MNKKYVVRLEQEEREDLERLVSTGKAAAYKIKHAHILLKADADGPAWTDGQIAEAFGCHARTVENVRRRFVTDSLAAALERKKREHPPREKVIDGEAEAHLIAVACSEPPEGRARWTLELLADKLVELNIVESVSYQTVRRTLRKTGISLTAAGAG
jgi:transposase